MIKEQSQFIPFEAKTSVEHSLLSYLAETKITDIDWQKANNSLSQISRTDDYLTIHQRLSQFEFKNDDQCFLWKKKFWSKEGLKTLNDYFVFLDSLTEQLARNEEGFNLLKQDLFKEKPPELLAHPLAEHTNQSEFDYMKSVFLQKMFQANPQETLSVCQKLLPELTRWSKNYAQIEDVEDWENDSEFNDDASLFYEEDVKHFNQKSKEPYDSVIKTDQLNLRDDESFPDTISVLLTQLAQCGKEGKCGHKEVDALIEYLSKDFFVSLHLKELTACFENIDINYAVDRLLATLCNKDTEEEVHKYITNILYRLEFGRIGISENGARYLERIYDLGEYNNPDYFVQRLTRDGDIGIFDENRELTRYFNLGDLTDESEIIKAQVISFAYETLFTPQADETEEERMQREQILEEFKRKYFKFFDDRFFQDTGVAFNNFSFKEQGQFMHFVEHVDTAKRQRALDFVKQYGEDGFRSFLSVEYGLEMGDVILKIGEQSPETAKKVFAAYSTAIDEAYKQADALQQEIQKDMPECQITQENILHGFFMRGRDLLTELGDNLGESPKNDAELITSFIQELKSETNEQKIERAYFKKIAELLSGDNIDLRKQQNIQAIVLQNLKRRKQLWLFLRVLRRINCLAPIPEIHWRVDRGLEEYRRRFGFDIGALIKELTDSNKKKILLEFGPGSGQSKAERAELAQSKHWMDIAMADKVYYPLDGFIHEMMDWEKLEQAIGMQFSKNDKIMLSDMLYKVIMIQDGQTGQDYFEYHQDRIERIKNDPNSMRQILPEIAPQLNNIDIVPTTLSARDNQGNVVYKYKHNIKEAKEKSPAFARAVEEIGNPEKISKYILDKDGYEAVPAYPVGMMIGDFSRIKALQNQQIDLAIGVRSTVYKRGEEYVDFLAEASKKLADNGLYVADDIRDNDGWYYRLAEVAKFYYKIEPEKNNLHISVILGDGFHGEDYRISKVPSALVISKGKDYKDIIAANLDKGYEIVPFDELISREGIKKYDIASLDATGHTLERLQKEQQEIELAKVA